MNDVTVFVYLTFFIGIFGMTFAFMWKMMSTIAEFDIHEHPELQYFPVPIQEHPDLNLPPPEPRKFLIHDDGKY